MTTDEGSSKAQSETREKVRDDIADSDIQQLVDTLNAALTVPYINLNFGEQAAYQKIDLFKPDEKNIEQIISAVERLGPLGLKVKADEFRSQVGLSNPEEGDETIGGRPEYAPAPQVEPEMNAALNAASDEVDAVPDNGGYTAISDDIATVIAKAADTATDFDGFRKELEKLVTGWPPDKIAECIVVAAFKARALGNDGFDGGA